MAATQGKCDFCGDRTLVFVAEDTGTGSSICERCADDAICAFMTVRSDLDAEADAVDNS